MRMGGIVNTNRKKTHSMPTSDSGKAIASRNATTHGLFARDVVLPALGEDPEGYRRLEAQWMAQLRPGNLLERHYVEKIAAASWRLRRFHRWQAQIMEDPSLTESERLDRLDKTLRHETALQRQIDAAVKMLNKDAAQLYAQRTKELIMDETQTTPREYAGNDEEAVNVDLKVQDRLRRLRTDTEAAGLALADAPLDAAAAADTPEFDKIPKPCDNEPGVPSEVPQNRDGGADAAQKCQNELTALIRNPFRWSEYLDPNHRHHPAPRSFTVTRWGQLK